MPRPSRTALATFPPGPVWPPGRRRSLWLEQALAAEHYPEPHPDRDSRLPPTADVCVVGGGFTGLWTALALNRRDPSLNVVVLEADICGGGASGRNGGFVMSAWSKFASLRKICGEADALRYAMASESAIASIGGFLHETGIDGEFRRAGWLWAATNPAQLGAWETAVEAIAPTGAAPYELLSRQEVKKRSGSEQHLGGVFERTGATFHPAKVARGLAAVARRRGITVLEGTPVRAVHGDTRPRVDTERGQIRADTVLLALNAWTAALPQARRSLVVTSSDMVATDPISERLDELGWEPGLSISDSRRLVNYYQRASDGRLVFGKGGGTLAFNGRVGNGFHGDSSRAAEVRAQFHYTFPQLSDVPVTRSWRGPIDYSVSGLPFMFKVGGHPAVLAAAGFSGNGCGPSYVVADALAAMALGQLSEDLPEALRSVPPSRLPPEPVRYLGGKLVRAAIARKEQAEDAARRPGRLTAALAGLDPTGFVDRGPEGAAPELTEVARNG
ncbi:MAG: FAD-binding oxidoreductase [Solirubrobacteraceae bacterium]